MGGAGESPAAAAGGRTLTVAQLLPALEGGGVERGTLEIGAALVAAGHRSLVVSAGGRMVAELEAAGSEHRRLAIGEKNPRVLFTVRRLRRLLRDEGVDLVHARSRLPAWVAWRALAGLSPRPAFVTTLHGLNSVSRYSSIMTRGDRVVAVSDTARDYWLAAYPELDAGRVSVIHRGIDPAAFPRGYRPAGEWVARFREESRIPAGARVLLLPGRVTRGKGAGTLVDLLARLPDDVHGLLVGGGSPRELSRVALRASSQGLAARFHRLPARADIREVMGFSDVVLSLSIQPESFGRTVVEALALGRPVVGFAHGGVGEILERCWPFGAVPRGDFRALVERVREALEAPPPPPEAMPYRLAEMQRQTLDLYRSLAGR